MELTDATEIQPEQFLPLEPSSPKPSFLTKPIKILIGIIAGMLIIIGSALGYQKFVKDKIIPAEKSLSIVSEWKTITNKEYGYSFKYPNVMSLYSPEPNPGCQACREDLYLFLKPDDASIAQEPALELKVYDNNTNGSKASIESLKDDIIVKSIKVEIGENNQISATKYTISSSKESQDISNKYVFAKNNITYMVKEPRDKIKKNIFDKILSTFEFVNQDTLRFDNFSFLIPKDWTGVISDTNTINLKNKANDLFIKVNERENIFPEAKTAKQYNALDKKAFGEKQSEVCKRGMARGEKYCLPITPGFTENSIAEADELFENGISAVEVGVYEFPEGNGDLKKYIVLKQSKVYEVLFEYPKNTNMLDVLKGIHFY